MFRWPFQAVRGLDGNAFTQFETAREKERFESVGDCLGITDRRDLMDNQEHRLPRWAIGVLALGPTGSDPHLFGEAPLRKQSTQTLVRSVDVPLIVLRLWRWRQRR